jgi:galactitol-specific phosphotransferase system IIB component
MDFTTVGQGIASHTTKKTKWSQIASKRFGNPQTNDKRQIQVVKKSVAGKDIFIVTIDLATRDGRAKNQFKRVFNAP